MLTDLGIGGIALALAAQKTLEDLFGGITITESNTASGIRYLRQTYAGPFPILPFSI